MNFMAVAIVFAIVLGYSSNKRVDICLVYTAFSFVVRTVARSPRWEMIPWEEVPPRLRVDRGRTLISVTFQISRNHQIAISFIDWLVHLQWYTMVSDSINGCAQETPA